MTTVNIQDVDVPTFFYGTAWKEERTEALVLQALAVGFTAFDTANLRRYFFEAGVGAALAKITPAERSRLFLQTKFCYRETQDHRLPYSDTADTVTQVRQSLASSKQHLGVTNIDSLLLHRPHQRVGLSKNDIQVWRTFEDLYQESQVGLIGVSNFTAAQLAELCRVAKVPPAFVQNRCYARLGWDRETRAVCRNEGVIYQGFSLLTVNRVEMHSATLRAIASRHGKTPAQVVFRFARSLGMICLTGSTNADHLRQDLASEDFELSAAELETLETISSS